MSDSSPASTARWGDLQKRVLSSLVLIPLAFFCLWRGGWVYDLMVMAIMAAMVWEAETLLGQDMRSWRGALFLLWPVCAALVALQHSWLCVAVLVGVAFMFGNLTGWPILISVVAGVSLLLLRAAPEGFWTVLFTIAVVVASDSCAYLTGRVVGGPKLAPAISPGKTVSGSLGGLLGAMVMGALVARAASGAWSLQAAGWAFVLAVAAQLGDLAESGFKRRLGVKDSGTLIPGHGGVLDRFDGILAAAPVAACILLLRHGRPFWQ
ncbi:phosphatidate cytidylyltransferase [Oecophyllibacter saccharovorans]|uniref:phosphatidate cytidylyltransferase n=1 Tax=Oecophyllibacter saccharovorans TaxID=2558360 RepID=UPI00114144F8|nr:phosphatidate cytidylyltransferase [Oecophyllibacter saccharovorans]QDH15663.1 phosphatidate cytidylyltransferase [Oecophyllibacter saccharovorans]